MAKALSSGAPAISRRAEQREGTQKRLLTAARGAFRSRGVEQVSMEDIAALAKVSRATIYLHFPGKPVLLKALLQEDWEQQVRLFDRLANVQASNAEQLDRWVLRVAEGMRRVRESFAIHWAAIGQNPELILGHHEHRTRLARRLMDWAGVDSVPAQALAIEAELIVAELEHFATAAAVAWSEEELAVALPIIVSRIRNFALVGASAKEIR